MLICDSFGINVLWRLLDYVAITQLSMIVGNRM